jgi:two-component system, NtrC family, nitrogen regulation sensor histidine kinase NtrY
MGFKRFRIICIVRVLLLTLTLVAILSFDFIHRTPAWIVIAATLLIFQIYALIRYVEQTNRDLARFFQSIRYEDYTQGYRDKGLGPSFSELRAILADVTEALRRTRAEKEGHAQYLQTIVQHVGIGLLVFQPDGAVELINDAAKRLLRVPWLKMIDALKPRSEELVDTLFRLPPKEQAFVKIEDEKESLLLSLSATEFKMHGREFKLVSFQNIHRELEEKEMEAWQKLIRVMTHEIMNSVTPISTLASTINGLVGDPSGTAFRPSEGADDGEVKRDIQLAAQTIEKRSQGLLHFVDAFRSLTLVPKPKRQSFPLAELLARVGRLMTAPNGKSSLHFSIEVEPASLELDADPELIEQILINLLLNARQAVEGRDGATIRVRGFLNERGRVIIQVIDNGPGIAAENIEKIFIPFFSTKKGGSGIGLSLSRQIMRLHKGAIHVHSEPGVRTVFTLTF